MPEYSVVRPIGLQVPCWRTRIYKPAESYIHPYNIWALGVGGCLSTVMERAKAAKYSGVHFPIGSGGRRTVTSLDLRIRGDAVLRSCGAKHSGHDSVPVPLIHGTRLRYHVQGRKGPIASQNTFLLLPSCISSINQIHRALLAPGTHLGLTWQMTDKLQVNVGWLG